MVLADGEPVERTALPTITIAPGVVATLGWGRGALLERVEMQPGAVYPSQTLNEELIVIVQDGSATIEFDGTKAELAKDHVLYLPARRRALGEGGAERVDGVRDLFAGAARSSRAGGPEHRRRERDLSGPGRDAVAPARRRRRT